VYTLRTNKVAGLVFLCVLLGLLAGVFNPEPIPKLFKHADKYEHAAAFFVVALTGAFYFKQLKFFTLYWLLWLVLAYSLEYLQGLYLPKRTFDLYDVYANAAGVVVAYILWLSRLNYIKNCS